LGAVYVDRTVNKIFADFAYTLEVGKKIDAPPRAWKQGLLFEIDALPAPSLMRA
jgi:hypothetical protein